MSERATGATGIFFHVKAEELADIYRRKSEAWLAEAASVDPATGKTPKGYEEKYCRSLASGYAFEVDHLPPGEIFRLSREQMEGVLGDAFLEAIPQKQNDLSLQDVLGGIRGTQAPTSPPPVQQ